MTDEAAKLLADAINNLAAALREVNRQTPARGLTTNIRAQDTYTGRTRRFGFAPAWAENEEASGDRSSDHSDKSALDGDQTCPESRLDTRTGR